MNKEYSAKIDSFLSQHRHQIVEDLKMLVSIPSVSVEGPGPRPFGNDVAKALDAALELATHHGLTAKNHGYYYGTARTGTGGKTIGIFSHLDVVPEGSGWVHSPYAPVEENGYLIGRGVADDKSGAIAGIYVMKCIQEMNLPFHSQISLFFGCNEECGMQDIKRYVAEQPMPDFSIVPDTNFPVCHGEKGILEGDVCCKTPFTQITAFAGGLASNMVPDAAEARMKLSGDLLEGLSGMTKCTESITVSQDGDEIVVRAKGAGAHAAHPQGSANAIALLAAFLAEARGIAEGDRAILATVADTLSDNYGETTGIAHSDEASGKLTCIYGLAKTVEGCLQLNFNIRYPVTDKGDRCIAGMKKYFETHSWVLVDHSDSAPMYMPKDDPKVVQLCALYTDITGKEAIPYVMGGGTYARNLKNAVGFGMESPEGTATPWPAGHGGVHQPDEAILIDDIMDAIKIYVLSLIEVDKLLNV